MNGSRIRIGIVTAALLGTAMGTPARGDAKSASPSGPVATHLQIIELGHGAQRYPFAVYANRRLDKGALADVKHLVIVIHGSSRDADRYAARASETLSSAVDRSRDTLIIAPKFLSPNERAAPALPAWRRDSWVTGEPSVSAPKRPAAVSAFQALDDLLLQFGERARLPSLSTVVVAGHSAGAQMVQRYAVLSPIDERLAKLGVSMRFIVANPASYLYLTTDRPANTKRGFGPYNRGICADYDSYRYGLDHLPAYAHERDPHKLAVRYAGRHVTYLLASADTNPEHRLLDKSCGAEAQGATRLSRGTAYLRYERTLTAAGAWTTHQGFVVRGLGHDPATLFNSACGAQALFGERASGRPAVPPPPVTDALPGLGSGAFDPSDLHADAQPKPAEATCTPLR